MTDTSELRAARIAALKAREGHLNARERYELNRLRNAQRIEESELENQWLSAEHPD
jgi:hypothetical protein